MKTYQDFLEVAEKSDRERMEFVLSAINNHKDSDLYKQAVIAKEYDAHRNVTIANFQKLLYTLNGKVIPDNYSPNYKLRSNFFANFVTQETQYLLGNGVTLKKRKTKRSWALGLTHGSKTQHTTRLSAAFPMASGISITLKCLM